MQLDFIQEDKEFDKMVKAITTAIKIAPTLPQEQPASCDVGELQFKKDAATAMTARPPICAGAEPNWVGRRA